MVNLAQRLTIEQAALACILTCFAAILLLHCAETKLAAALHVAEATYNKSTPPEGCDSDSLKPIKNDLQSFDPRAAGYTRKQAVALLCAMHANDKRAANEYLNNRFYWDMLFPIAYGPGLAVILLFLVGWWGLGNWWAYAALLLPLSGAGFDIAENFAVRSLIETGPSASVAATDFASYLTTIKYALVLPAFVVGAAGMLFVLTKRSFSR